MFCAAAARKNCSRTNFILHTTEGGSAFIQSRLLTKDWSGIGFRPGQFGGGVRLELVFPAYEAGLYPFELVPIQSRPPPSWSGGRLSFSFLTLGTNGRLSKLHTIDAAKTVERIVGVFPMAEQHTLRNRLAKSFRYIISQRLVPRKDGAGRVAIIEILKSTLRTREYVEKGESDGKTLLDAMRVGDQEGMQHFDGNIERLIREGILDLDTGMAYATNPGNLQLQLSDLAISGGGRSASGN